MVAVLILLGGGFAFAANQNDTLGSTVKGEPWCSMTITSGGGPWTFVDDSGECPRSSYGNFQEGLDDYSMYFHIEDNQLNPTAGATLISVQITSGLPDAHGQYGCDTNTYCITMRGAYAGGKGADDDIGTGSLQYQNQDTEIDGTDKRFWWWRSSPAPTGHILNNNFYLIVELWFPWYRKCLRGDTHDDYTVTLTYHDM